MIRGRTSYSSLRMAGTCVLLALVLWPAIALGQLDVKEIDYDKVFQEGFLRGGTELNLSGKKIGDEGVKRMLELKGLEKVKKLDLRYNEITEEGARLLAESKRFSRLQKLEIKHNFLMDAGTVLLADAKHFPKVEFLGLGWNEVRDQGALALAHSKSFPKLKKLDLRGNWLAGKTKDTLKKELAHLKKLLLEVSL